MRKWFAIFGLLISLAALGGQPSTSVQGATVTPTPALTPIGGGAGKLLAISYDVSGRDVGNLYLLNADGSAPQRLTALQNVSVDANKQVTWHYWAFYDWARDGSYAFAAVSDNASAIPATLYRIDGARYTIQRVATIGADVGEVDSVTIAPDGKEVAMAIGTKQGEQIDVIDPTGKNLHQLIQGNADTPAWSPDGTTIAFSSVQNGQLGLYLAQADGSGIKTLLPALPILATPSATAVPTPAATSDATAIATAPANLTVSNIEYVSALRWSPGSDRLALIVTANPDPQTTIHALYVLTIDGSNLLPIARDVTGVAWLDASTLVISASQGSGQNQTFRLVSIGADGSNQKDLLNSQPGALASFTVAPDGSGVLYDVDHGVAHALYWLTLGDLSTQQIGKSGKSFAYPIFQP